MSVGSCLTFQLRSGHPPPELERDTVTQHIGDSLAKEFHVGSIEEWSIDGPPKEILPPIYLDNSSLIVYWGLNSLSIRFGNGASAGQKSFFIETSDLPLYHSAAID